MMKNTTPLHAEEMPHHIESSSSILSLSSSPSSSSSFCPPFQTEQDYESYLSSIAPPRELICPITQELLHDPVIASDGHTYERKSLVTWLSMGNHRSPVTNSLLENTNPNSLVPNLVVSSMANLHRERLGNELMNICRGVLTRSRNNGDVMLKWNDDESSRGIVMRIEGLLEAGADPNGRGGSGVGDGDDSNTPLHLLIQSGNLRLASHLLHHEASVLLTNDSGLDCIATAQKVFLELQQNQQHSHISQLDGGATMADWTDFIHELRRREGVEKARIEARDRARSQANDAHRERQRTLAANARSSLNNAGQQHGLGRMEDGVGYFPCLAALQFQASIPAPSPSVAEHENAEKERLNVILRCLNSHNWMNWVTGEDDGTSGME